MIVSFSHLNLDLLVPDPLLDLGGLELVRQLGLGFLNFLKKILNFKIAKKIGKMAFEVLTAVLTSLSKLAFWSLNALRENEEKKVNV